MKSTTLTHRQALIKITDRLEDYTIIKPENVLLHLIYDGKFFDVGALCYRSVEEGPLYSGTKLGRQVDESTFDPARRGAVVALIDYIKSRGSNSSNGKILAGIRAFQVWADNYYLSPVNFN